MIILVAFCNLTLFIVLILLRRSFSAARLAFWVAWRAICFEAAAISAFSSSPLLCWALRKFSALFAAAFNSLASLCACWTARPATFPCTPATPLFTFSMVGGGRGTGPPAARLRSVARTAPTAPLNDVLPEKGPCVGSMLLGNSLALAPFASFSFFLEADAAAPRFGPSFVIFVFLEAGYFGTS